jgi:thiol peroxidase
MDFCKVSVVVSLALVLMSCTTTKPDFKVSQETVAPGGSITWVGEKTTLAASKNLAVNKEFPASTLVNEKMETQSLDLKNGNVKIISIVPSVDTPVCEEQTHMLSESKTIHPAVERITVSKDLPYAQKRFVSQSSLTNVMYLSDYRDGKFGKSTGLEIQRNGLLTRAVIVVDGKGIVRYMQIVPEITSMPDMEKAISVANLLIVK